jgi:thiol-disulfide isomerase/thioredoxin
MTALWAVTVLLAVVVVVDSVAIMALARQVGVLHLRLKPLSGTAVRYGPTIGEPIVLDRLAALITPGIERAVIAFVAPHCGTCAALLPVFRLLAGQLPDTERLVFAGDVDEADLSAYLAGYDITLPVCADANALRGNNVPGTPFVAVVDSDRNVLSAGAVHNVEQIEFLLDQGRHEHQAHQHEAHQHQAHEHQAHEHQRLIPLEPIGKAGA